MLGVLAQLNPGCFSLSEEQTGCRQWEPQELPASRDNGALLLGAGGRHHLLGFWWVCLVLTSCFLYQTRLSPCHVPKQLLKRPSSLLGPLGLTASNSAAFF